MNELEQFFNDLSDPKKYSRTALVESIMDLMVENSNLRERLETTENNNNRNYCAYMASTKSVGGIVIPR